MSAYCGALQRLGTLSPYAKRMEKAEKIKTIIAITCYIVLVTPQVNAGKLQPEK